VERHCVESMETALGCPRNAKGLGELIAGIVLGNLVLVNPAWSFLEPLRATPIRESWALILDSLARIGVIILLFEVGLESTVAGMIKVGKSALLVAVLGVIAPFLLGFAASWILVKELPAALAATAPGLSLNYVHLFMGAVLCATSVGITARVYSKIWAGSRQKKHRLDWELPLSMMYLALLSLRWYPGSSPRLKWAMLWNGNRLSPSADRSSRSFPGWLSDHRSFPC
jgi:hypothetical protein